MCSILGGTEFLSEYAQQLYKRAKSRGRDFSGLVEANGLWICNHRGTPVNETSLPNVNQPFGKDGNYFVHNGTICNDAELGNAPGNIDSQVIAQVVRADSFENFAADVQRLKGSYAIGCLTKGGDIFLACNYKPIFVKHVDGEFYFSSLAEHLGVGAMRVAPYTCMELKSGYTVEIPRAQANRALVVCSGGLDSTSVVGYAKKMHSEITLLHYNYGCLASNKELNAVQEIANFYNCNLIVKELDYTGMKGSSPLFGNGDNVAKGTEGVEYAKEWVCARNLIMLSTAVGIAEAQGYGYIYLGNNLEEAGAYPDNEEQFVNDFNALLWGAVNEGIKVEVKMPVGHLMKREVIEFGIEHGSPLHLSWSCYKGATLHCGECACCYMRQKAFGRSGHKDPTIYTKTQ